MMQGDVFDNVMVPGLDDNPMTVMVATHPCSMRRGVALADRIAVIPVNKYEKINEITWQRHMNVMPLPDLRNDGKPYAGDFRQVSSVRSGELDLGRRISAFSAKGFLILHQRSISFWTRFKVPLEDLAQESARILTETELQRDWAEEALLKNEERPTLDVVRESERDFHAWLDENDRERRDKLKEVTNHASLRRESRKELTKRYQ
jgi:hypothetical protein